MSDKDTGRRRYLLRSLNLFGLDHLDPVILAALADGQPLLLVGAHGTAKSELLNRIASALSLEHRHYNASLISFDDLLGYPVPNAQRNGLEYLRTPGDLWEAESVFLDKISRCRPEHQNKLFSIVHERRIQGLPLERLRYRWSAMNPPLTLDGDEEEGEEQYQGSLPLDTALADRFAYVITVPAFSGLAPADRARVIAHGGEAPGGESGLPALVEAARQAMAGQGPEEARWVADYVNALVVPLREAGLAISGRRAVVLARTTIAVHVACRVLGRDETLADAAFLALKWGLPQRAQGRRIREPKLIAVHQAALRAAGAPRTGLRARLREERDPVRRVALALFSDDEPPGRIELSQLVSDAWAGLSLPACHLFSRNLLPAIDGDRLTAATYELLLEPATKVLAFTEQNVHPMTIPRSQTREWDRLLATIHRLRRADDPEATALGNTLLTLFVVEGERFDSEALVEQDRAYRGLFQETRSVEAA